MRKHVCRNRASSVPTQRLRTCAFLVACMGSVAACQPSPPGNGAAGPDSNSVARPPTAPLAAGETPTPPLGMVAGRLTDGSGRSVYVLAGNRDGSKCDAVCEAAWPPVLVNAAVGRVEGVEHGTLATRARADGTLQLTYRTQPLYRYAGDGSAGTTSGHGLKDKWGEWTLAEGSEPTPAQGAATGDGGASSRSP